MMEVRAWHQSWPNHVDKTLAYPDQAAWWILTRNLIKYADQTAIRHLDVETGEEICSLTYGELAARARTLAAGLRANGVGAGDRVVMYMPNSPELIASYYGVWMAGAVGVPCNFMNKHTELEYQIRDSGAVLLLAGAEMHSVATLVAAAVGVKFCIVPTAGVMPAGAPAGDLAWNTLLSGPEMDPIPVANPAEDLALLLYTGGTTGRSKGAMLTHRNLVANAVQYSHWYAMGDGDEVCVGVLPICHSGGMSGAMNIPLFSGSTILLFQRFKPDTVLRTIQNYRATRFFGVPTMYVAILGTEGSSQYDLSSLRACRTGAAPLPAAVKTAFDELVGYEVLFEGYGLSETSPLVLANPLSRAKAGSIGVPLSDTDAVIVDPQTAEPLPFGETGELALRGPQVMKGYWNQPEENAANLKSGWFLTGDIVTMDDDGYFWIVDRKKDFINSSGFKVSPREVEEVLYTHPAVRLAAVIGVPDSYRGEAVAAFVVPRDPSVTEAELRQFCRAHLANYKVPRTVHFRMELPMSGAGKILRRVLRESVEALPVGD